MLLQPPLNCENSPSPALTLVQLFLFPHSSRTIVCISPALIPQNWSTFPQFLFVTTRLHSRKLNN